LSWKAGFEYAPEAMGWLAHRTGASLKFDPARLALWIALAMFWASVAIWIFS
jgi:hypothetical protein